MKQLIKRLMFRVAPQWSTTIQSARSRAHSHRLIAEWGLLDLNKKLVAALGTHVVDGPFRGIKLGEMALAEHIGPFLLGLYECELNEFWRVVLGGAYKQIIDVGAKFGYYAVGLAKQFPMAEVLAYDTDWWARKALREMSALNGTSNVRVLGYCEPRLLQKILKNNSFIISDCEGYEGELFCTEDIPGLATATMIIETHDALVAKVSSRLRDRFNTTHLVQEVAASSAPRESSQSLEFMTPEQRAKVCQEIRLDSTWLCCLPKTGANEHLHQLAN